jgi:hypothetical protein
LLVLLGVTAGLKGARREKGAGAAADDDACGARGVVVVLAEPGGVADELDGLSGFEEEERD